MNNYFSELDLCLNDIKKFILGNPEFSK